MTDFVHLHLHTEYSLLDGMCRVAGVTRRAARLGMKALAITDHGKMFGVVPFYQEALSQGVKPIIGCELYLAPGSRFDKQASRGSDPYSHLTVMARNATGYLNLMRLCTLAHTEGFYHRPRIDREILEKYSEGLIVLSGCLKGEINSLLGAGRFDEAEKLSGRYREVFGSDFFLEIQDNGLPEQKKINPLLVDLGAKTGVPLVATNDCHYLRQEDSVAHDALLCVQTASKIEDEARMRFSSDQFFFRSGEEMAALFKDVPGALRNTVSIAERCNLQLDFGKTLLPQYETPDGSPLNEYLRKLAALGLGGKYGVDPDHLSGKQSRAVVERMEKELDVIGRMGYSGYFLIIQDIVNHARRNGIAVGPGRGSAAGSLVAYLLGITGIDPLRYGLLFERFLNPERVSMPDIDIDFEDARREEVITYIRGKYGENQLAQIVTFGTLSARAVIRDVGRVLGMGYADVDRIAKMVPAELHIRIADALKKVPELGEMIERDARVKQLFEISAALEGLPRHASTHAAGIVIGPGPLEEYTPLFLGTNNAVTTQYEMNALGELGLLKIDLLGLKTLTVIKNTAKLVRERNGQDLDPEEIPLDDQEAYRLLSEANTFGVFQLESAGMRDLLRKIKPRRFEDLIAILALYRPGPLGSGMVDSFISGRRSPGKISYIHPMLEEILKPTYGIILYQEQVMEIVHRLGNFTLAQSDLFRRAMGKKIPEIMEENRALFLKGARANGVSAADAEKIFNNIVQFAGYGFNKSHSAGYAIICYQTAWFKANHPLEFMAALLTSESGNSDKIVEYIGECDRMKIWVLPPCVEESRAEFTVFGNDIRFGLAAVKNVGLSAIKSIIRAQEKGGRFKTLPDFCRRVDLRLVNRRVLESLVKTGALDVFNLPRRRMMAMLPSLMSHASAYQEEKKRGQGNLFGGAGAGGEDAVYQPPPETAALTEWSELELLAHEKEVLGFYLSGHPLGHHESVLKRFANESITGLSALEPGAKVRVGGIIEKVKRLSTRKEGRPMASFTMEDLSGKTEVMAFPETFEKISGIITEGNIVLVEGRLDFREEQPQVLASDVVPVSAAAERYARRLTVTLYPPLEETDLEKIRDLAGSHPGPSALRLRIVFAKGREITLEAGPSYRVSASEGAVAGIEKITGRGSVAVA